MIAVGEAGGCPCRHAGDGCGAWFLSPPAEAYAWAAGHGRVCPGA
eukprot:gene41301-15500_t